MLMRSRERGQLNILDERPSIDVIVPFHRNDNFLQECIQSILKSRGVSVNLILIDDRSRDDRTSIKNFDSYVRVRTEGLVGFPKATNLAKNYLKSDFVGLCGSDDLVMPFRFKSQIENLVRNNSDLSVASMQKITEDGKILRNFLKPPNMANYKKEILLLTSYGADATWVARRAWWDANVYFEEGPLHDWELGLKIIESTKLSGIHDIVYQYRMSSNQRSRNQIVLESNTTSFVKEWQKYNQNVGLPPLKPSNVLLLTNFLNINKASSLKELEIWFEKAFSLWKKDESLKRILFTKLVIIYFLTKGRIKIRNFAMRIQFVRYLMIMVASAVWGGLSDSRNLESFKKNL